MDRDFIEYLLGQEDDISVLNFYSDAFKIRTENFGDFIETCAILNAKSGRCSSDCKFCSQSALSRAKIEIYPLLSRDKLLEKALFFLEKGVDRFSFVCSGVKISVDELKIIGDAVEKIKVKNDKFKICVSLGQLRREEFSYLKSCGVDRYHHNLETSKEHYGSISAVQNWEDRYKTVALAKEAGFSVCSGGIFGIGEAFGDIISLFDSIASLEVDSVPLNFFHPVKGTPFEKFNFLTPVKCLRIVMAARFYFPSTSIRICGGREWNFKELQPLAISLVDGIMVGNYLTVKGRTLEDDMSLFRDLCLNSSL